MLKNRLASTRANLERIEERTPFLKARDLEIPVELATALSLGQDPSHLLAERVRVQGELEGSQPAAVSLKGQIADLEARQAKADGLNAERDAVAAEMEDAVPDLLHTVATVVRDTIRPAYREVEALGQRVTALEQEAAALEERTLFVRTAEQIWGRSGILPLIATLEGFLEMYEAQRGG